MTAIPAWKQSLLEKRRKAEDGEKKRLQNLDELPSWKRDLILKKRNSAEHDREVIVNGDSRTSETVRNDNEMVVGSKYSSRGKVTPRTSEDTDVGDGEHPLGHRSPRGSVVINENGGKKSNDVNDDEISYQPGFVHKLLNKFSTISVNDRSDSSVMKLKKAPSLESVIVLGSTSDSSDATDEHVKEKSALSLSKNKFRSMDNILTADEKRLEFSVTPRNLSDSFGKEDHMIIIDKDPPPTNTTSASKTSPNPVVVKSGKECKDKEEEGETVISVSKMKSLFESDSKPVAPPRRIRTPRSADGQTSKKEISSATKPTKAKAPVVSSNDKPATIPKQNSTNSNVHSSSTTADSSSKTIIIPKSVNTGVHSVPSDRQQQGEEPKLLSFRKLPDSKNTTHHTENSGSQNSETKQHKLNNVNSSLVKRSAPSVGKPKSKPISVINRINGDHACGDTIYGGGDNQKLNISEADLAGIRRAGKSWFFTTTSINAPAASVLVKMKLRKVTNSLSKRTKTVVNNLKKEQRSPGNFVTRNDIDNKLKQVTSNNSAAQSVPATRKRHAPQAPKHLAVLRVSKEVKDSPMTGAYQPAKSSLSKGSGKKLRIQFNDDANLVHEYPSEKVLIQHLPKEPDCTYADDMVVTSTNDDDDDADDEVDEPQTKNMLTSTPSIGTTGSLSSYQSKFQMDYQFGMSMKEEAPVIPSRPEDEKMEEDDDNIEITYADDLDTNAWSSSANSDMLF